MDNDITVFRATPVPIGRFVSLVTNGRNPAIDVLAICQELLSELKPYERQAIVDFLRNTVYA